MQETPRVNLYFKGGSLDGYMVQSPSAPLSIKFPWQDEYWRAYHERGRVVYTTMKPRQKQGRATEEKIEQ